MSSEKSEVRLPWALREDNHVEININNIGDYRGNFLCKECLGRLMARRGGERQYHFAHYSEQGLGCSLRTKIGVEDNEQQTSCHPDNYRQTRSATPRGVIAITVSNSKARLWYRLFPSKLEHNFDDNISNYTTINNQKFDPLSMDYHSESDIYIEINPSEKKYTIKISGDLPQGYPETQESLGIRIGDIFITSSSINNSFANRVDYGSCIIDYGDIIYVVDDRGTIPLLRSPYKLLKYEVDEENIEIIEKELNVRHKDTSPFSTDIILPAFVNPSLKRGITGNIGDSVLIGIQPKKTIPYVGLIEFENNNETRINIEKQVGLLSREIRENPDYFSIHWGSTHQEMSIVPRKNDNVLTGSEISGLTVISGEKQHDLRGGKSIIINAMALKNLSECVSAYPSPSLIFNFEIMSNKGKPLRDRGTIEDISDLAKEHSINLESIRVWNNRSKKIEIVVARASEKTIKEAINKVGIPTKINKTYLKKILEEMKLSEAPGGFQKKVRRAVREIKNER